MTQYSSSSSDSCFPVAFFNGKTKTKFCQYDFDSFKDFAEQLAHGAADDSSHEVRTEKDGEGFSCVRYRIGTTTRGDDNVDSAHAVGLDYDRGAEEDLFAALDKLDRFLLFWYTTFSHSEQQWKLRVIVALATAVSASAYPAVWEYLHQLTGAISDPTCKNVSRFFYSPSRPPGSIDPDFVIHDTTSSGQPAVPLDASLIVPATVLTAPPRPSPAALARANVIEMPGWLRKKPRPAQAELYQRLTESTNEDTRRLAHILTAGKPFTDPGCRDAVLNRLAGAAAFVAPESTVDDLTKLFEHSIAAMQALDTPSVVKAHGRAPTMENVRRKLERQLRRRWEQLARERQLLRRAGFTAH